MFFFFLFEFEVKVERMLVVFMKRRLLGVDIKALVKANCDEDVGIFPALTRGFRAFEFVDNGCPVGAGFFS